MLLNLLLLPLPLPLLGELKQRRDVRIHLVDMAAAAEITCVTTASSDIHSFDRIW